MDATNHCTTEVTDYIQKRFDRTRVRHTSSKAGLQLDELHAIIDLFCVDSC